MTQADQRVKGRILPPKEISAEELALRKEKRRQIAVRCRAVFDRLRPELIEMHYNWFIGIDPDKETYLIDPELKGLMQQIKNSYDGTDVKLTIFRLNETGTCGNIWVIDGTEFTVSVYVGDDIPETAMGSAWLNIMELVVNKPKGILQLNIILEE